MGVDAAAADRLPWLADEPAREPAKLPARRARLTVACAAVALVGAAALWLGGRASQDVSSRSFKHVQPTVTLQLPPPHVAVSPEVRMARPSEIRPVPVPEVRQAAPKEVRIAPPPHVRAAPHPDAKPQRHQELALPVAQQPQATAPVSLPASGVTSSAPADRFVTLKPWNPRVFAGAAGRMVQIGSFGSVRQAKHGWWFMVRTYPAMAHLPAVVRPSRNSKGRVFFRFQVGTTSQAHSEVLCQRMEKIGLSCAVIGLPFKAKVER